MDLPQTPDTQPQQRKAFEPPFPHVIETAEGKLGSCVDEELALSALDGPPFPQPLTS